MDLGAGSILVGEEVLAVLGLAITPILFLVFQGLGVLLPLAFVFSGLTLFPAKTTLAQPKAAVALFILTVALTIAVVAANGSFAACQSPCPNSPCDYAWMAPYGNAISFGSIASVSAVVLLLAPLPSGRTSVTASKGLQCPICGRLHQAGAGRLCSDDNEKLYETESVLEQPRPEPVSVVDLVSDPYPWIAWGGLTVIAAAIVYTWANSSLTSLWSSPNLALSIIVVVSAVAGTWAACTGAARRPRRR